MSISKDSLFDSISQQFQYQNAAKVSFLHIIRTNRWLPMYNLFIDYINLIQFNPIVTNQPSRPSDQTFMLNTITTSAPALSKRHLSRPNIADTYSMSSSNNIALKRYKFISFWKFISNIKSTNYYSDHRSLCELISIIFCLHCETHKPSACENTWL